MEIRVLFFASFKDRVGSRSIQLNMPEGSRLQELRTELMLRYPALNPGLKNAVASINQQFAFDEDFLPMAAEVAFFPPVSGGSHPTIVQVTEQSLDLNALVQQVTEQTTGAVVLFTGIVRGKTKGGEFPRTLHLEYEAYLPMAIAKLTQIAEEIRSRWPEVEGIALVQRIGLMSEGTPTVAVVCAASHRNKGVFEAARYGIDRIKEIVPVWKKEIGPNGETWVEGDYLPTRSD